MKKHLDGRTVKGQRISKQGRESILRAYIALIRSGVPSPTAREIAERAGLSIRVIFKHFPNLRTLRLESFARLQAQSSKFFAGNPPERASALERLEFFVNKHARRLEFVTPLHRTAAMVESIDPDVADAIRAAREAARRDLERALGASLDDFPPSKRRDLVTALHIICSWEAWQILRVHYRMSSKRARRFVIGTALAMLAQAERTIRAAQKRLR
ncbi:MAG TPA: TetR/AcrR family transcriptional regulator [Candidatus Binataceae bacterium]|nr:TetR/AcrR family transcriptional regulator [Candidatus Binataceae bacterium]